MPQKNWLQLQIESNISINETPDKVDINEQNDYGQTPLNWACKNNVSIEIIKWLIEKKADVNITDNKGNTPRHSACKNKDTSVEMLKLLFSKTNLNLKNRDGKTPLDLACEKNNLEVAKLLILHGAKKPDLSLKWSEEIEKLLKLYPKRFIFRVYQSNSNPPDMSFSISS